MSISKKENHLSLSKLLFKMRGFTPIPLALGIIYFSEPVWHFLIFGIILVLCGEILRIWAVRAAGKTTRTRTANASQLVTWGPYRLTRNPLYIGNFLIWIGFTLMVSKESLPIFLAVVLLFFMFQYSLIVKLEETRLAEIFGEFYSEYRRKVNRIIPNWRNKNLASKPLHSIRYAFQSEKSTLLAILLTGILIFLRNI